MQTLRAPERGYTYAAGQDVKILDCCNCGITFGIPHTFEHRRREDGRSFYCPNGHPQGWYDDTTAKQLEREKNRRAAAQARADREQARADAEANRARAEKAAKTRMRHQRDRLSRFAAAGVCPVPGCGRSFKQLRRHLATKHPAYVHAHEHGD